jgi:hypothetical protein
MSHDSTTTGRGPWRILVLDRSPDDPKWLVCTVAPGDVRAVTDFKFVIPDVDETTAVWAASAAGVLRPAFTRLVHPEVWRIDEGSR